MRSICFPDSGKKSGSKTKSKIEKVSKRTPKSRRNLKSFLSDDSDEGESKALSDSEMEQPSESSKRPVKKSHLEVKKSRQSFLNSSSEDEDTTIGKEPSQKDDLDSSSSTVKQVDGDSSNDEILSSTNRTSKEADPNKGNFD